jgi:hypothetical protein
LAFPSDFRRFNLTVTILAAAFFACGIAAREKSLSPNLMFTTGSSFLDGARTLALKGRIEFEGDRIAQSGSFQLFINGSDSLSFLVEGPFGADVFRMIITGQTAYLLSDKEVGWETVHRDEGISVEEYGIQNISPFYLGLFAFPQFYLHLGADSISEYSFHNEKIMVQQSEDRSGFLLFDPRSKVAAAYTKPKNVADGYYPSNIKIFEPDNYWQIDLRIDKIRLNPALPEKIWRRGS